jgi:hypothetical protein
VRWICSVASTVNVVQFDPLGGRVIVTFPSVIAGLFLVPEGQDVHRVIGRDMTVQGDTAGIAEGYQLLA